MTTPCCLASLTPPHHHAIGCTRRSYTAGPPPDGRSVDEHLDELQSTPSKIWLPEEARPRSRGSLKRGSLLNQVQSKHGDFAKRYADGVVGRLGNVGHKQELHEMIRLAVLDGALAEWETR